MTNGADAWQVLKVVLDGEVNYKLFRGFYGGYTGSDSWFLNSGITEYEMLDDSWIRFHSFSGSIYEVHLNCERMTGLMSSVYNSFLREIESMKLEGSYMQVISFDQFQKEFKNDNTQ